MSKVEKKSLKDRVHATRQLRAKILQKFGIVPASVMETKISKAIDFQKGQTLGTRSQIQDRFKAGGLSQEDADFLLKINYASNVKASHQKYGYSKFPPNICEFLVKFYSEEGDTVYDPCAGHNSRMEVVWRNNRNYIGYDISKDFMEANEQIKEMLLGDQVNQQWLPGLRPPSTIELYCRDSRNCHLPDNSIDFTLTSPPYWNSEYYGDEPEQLGWKKSYPEFLKGLEQIIREQFRILKPGRFCALNVNDIRRQKVLIPFHSDVITIGKNVGFTLWDFMIMVWRPTRSHIFLGNLARNRYLGKEHEYIIIFRKPGGQDFWKNEFGDDLGEEEEDF